jgi:hypothetical protein
MSDRQVASATQLRRVEVEWLDSMSEGRWVDMETAVRTATREAMCHRSVGYLIHETDDLVLLAGSRSEGGENVADTMQIPRVAVLAVHDLKGAK